MQCGQYSGSALARMQGILHSGQRGLECRTEAQKPQLFYGDVLITGNISISFHEFSFVWFSSKLMTVF